MHTHDWIFSHSAADSADWIVSVWQCQCGAGRRSWQASDSRQARIDQARWQRLAAAQAAQDRIDKAQPEQAAQAVSQALAAERRYLDRM